MRDKVSVSRVALLHPAIRDEVTLLIEKVECGLPEGTAIRVVQGFRTFAEQTALYALGRTKVNPDGKSTKNPLGNIVTNAKAGTSYHNYGLAIDFSIVIDRDKNGTWDELSWDVKADRDKDKIPEWSEMSNVFEAYGYEWGGRWRTFLDLPHLQKTFGLSWKTLLDRHNKKDFIPGTQYVRL